MNCTLEELATSLTMPTFLVLYKACKFVPFSFLKGREAIIVNIMRALNIDLSGSKLSCAIEAIDCHKEALAVGLLQPTSCGEQLTALGVHICAF